MSTLEQTTIGKSTILKEKCPYCGKIAKELKHEIDESGTFVYLECGHGIFRDKVKEADKYEIISSDGKTLFPYQVDGLKFLENSSGRALIADEMGLGKTVQALAYLKLHPEALPALVICKAKVKMQWVREIARWCGREYFPLTLDKGIERPLEGFPIYVVTFDLIRRVTGRSRKKEQLAIINNTLEQYNAEIHENPLAKFPFKTIIIDETQQIKNPSSLRTQEVRKVCAGRQYIIGLSGTPAKNNAAEMFSILNILNPTRFPVLSSFIVKFCDQYWNGYGYKVGGIRDLEQFKAYTSDLMIRRERKEVLPDLPLINRVFHSVEVENKAIQKEYNAAIDEFDEAYYDEEPEMQNILAKMSRLRHLSGLAKVEGCVDQVAEFLRSVENEKIVVFSHHHDVAIAFERLLNAQLNDDSEEGLKDLELNPVINLVEKDTKTADNLITKLKDDPKSRVCIASTLASGEGLNLQFISRCIMLERQWNPANEEQAEARFPRPGQKADRIDATYMIALGTIDEFFTELVEKKREWIASIHKETEYTWDQSSLMKELADTLAASGKKKFKLK